MFGLGPRRRYASSRFSLSIILLAVVIVSALFGLPAIPKSYAHAFILKSNPADSQTLGAPPSSVTVYFSDPVDVKYSQVKVIDSAGKQVDNKDLKYVNGDQTVLSVTLPQNLKNGIYTVSTKVLDSTDGHVTDNAFVFGIGVAPPNSSGVRASSAQLQIPEAVARFPALVGQVLVAGVAFAAIWLWKPITKIGWLDSSLLRTRARIDASLTKLMVIAAIILLASGVGMIIIQANSIGAGVTDAIQTKFGNVWIIRMVQSAIVLAIAIGMYNRVRKRKHDSTSDAERKVLLPRGELVALFVVGMAVLATTTMISHAASTSQSTPIALDFIHNAVASIWIGGVIYLAFVVLPELRRSARESAGQERQAIASALTIIIPRFSIVILALLGAIVITGPFLLYTLEPNLDLTLSSLYGKALIAKLIIAGGMAVIGGYNQRIIHREALNATLVTVGTNGRAIEEKGTTNPGRPSKGGSGGTAGGNFGNPLRAKNDNLDSILSKFKKSTTIESGLGIGLLVAVAVLVNTGTPASEFSNIVQQNTNTNATTPVDQSLTQTAFVENASRVVLHINPFSPGNNDFAVSFLDQNKNPIDMKSVQLRYTEVDKGIGPIIVETKQVSTGVFGANAAFGLAGHWSLRVEGVPSKSNALSYVATYDLFVKPKPSQLSINIQEYRIPDNSSSPLFPVYDQSRNSIWVGDTAIASSQLWEFNITSSKYIQHKLPGVNLATILSTDSAGKIWYIDPLSRKLGSYDPGSDKNQLYSVPTNGTLSGMAADDRNHAVWVVDTTGNQIYQFDVQSQKFVRHFGLPGDGANPFSVTLDQSTGFVWVLDEALGKLARIDPSQNYNITEFAPPGKDGLVVPTAMLIDPTTGLIYISEHEGHAVDAFNPLLKTFTKYPLDQDPTSLPFGLAMDGNHLIWVAQHTLNKVAVLDPRTGEFNEADIPLGATQTQWLTSDSQGNVWLAEQRGAAIGLVTSIAKPSAPAGQANSQGNSNQSNPESGIFHLGVNYSTIVGPSVAAGVIGAAVLYTRSVQNLYQSIRQARGADPSRATPAS